MRAFLKIKVVSLAAEARLIRRNEQRHLSAERWLRQHKSELFSGGGSTNHSRAYFGLRDHRTGVVRGEARAAHLAYGFLRGIEYAQMERPTNTNQPQSTPPKTRVLELVRKYGEGNRKELEDRLKLWWDGSLPVAKAA